MESKQILEQKSCLLWLKRNQLYGEFLYDWNKMMAKKHNIIKNRTGIGILFKIYLLAMEGLSFKMRSFWQMVYEELSNFRNRFVYYVSFPNHPFFH